MKRRPQGWAERFERSLQADPNPALEEWRWAQQGEEPCDPRAIDAAWDLVTLHASAEAHKLNHALRVLKDETQRTLLAALVVAGARAVDVGTFEVVAADGRRWFPRDLDFVPGRDHLEPELRLECGVEEGRSFVDFRVWHRCTAYRRDDGDDRTATAERRMAILLTPPERSMKERAHDGARDLELQSEGYLVVRHERSEVWRDPLGIATDALRTLTETARFDAEAQFR